ncbi:CAF17-like 4Fe-4S cluster assembly/insertion protein YgfZ [Legionella sp. CNM-4043-24]|uniref:CAF17-like 4Fe-4S cluster assembly/insertion protein YgfZ n=1 Tax=Legionella sp. CNM-4043-24 TaxID=3421646 RepID=UPI00403B07F5
MPDYVINERPYHTLAAINDELRLSDDCNALYDLSYLSLIEIDGPRAAEFLQGQMSCDVNQVGETQMRRGLFCNLQGRIQAMADVIYWHGYQLVLPEDLIPAMLTTLAKTALVSRVKPSHNTGCYVYGLHLPRADSPMPLRIQLPETPFSAAANDEMCCYSIGNHCYILVSKSPLADMPMRGSLSWHRLQLALGQVEIYPDTQSLFLPHRLELQKKSYISFDKGCYKGQEIIARTHYRARLKHSLRQFLIPAGEPLSAGKKIMAPDTGAEVGELIDFSPVSADTIMISVSILNEYRGLAAIEDHQGPAGFFET